MAWMRGRMAVAVSFLFIIIGILAPASQASAAAGPYVWIEGEAPATTNLPPTIGGAQHNEFHSGGKWLTYALNPDEVAKRMPADGILLSYNFTAPADGNYTVWNRVVWDSIRSPFSWRIDGGNWTEIPHNHITIDLMEAGFFQELSWLNMGQAQLTKGDHKLEIRAEPTNDDKGKVVRLVYGSDCMCLIAGEWTPFSKFKPDENWQTPADVAAGKVVYTLPDAAGPSDRASIALKGTWEFARAPEHFDEPKRVAQAMAADDIPADPRWVAIEVPSNKNDRPELLMDHTFVYRTRVAIPASAAGRSFFIAFPENSLNSTVFCNGVLCGFNKNPLAPFTIDITKAAKAGATNEIEVAMRDTWYAYEFDLGNPNWHEHFLTPLQITSGGFQHMIYPVQSDQRGGILQAPVLTSTGPAYVSDVFVKPSVAKHELDAEVTLENPTANAQQGQIACEAIDAKTGAVEKTLPPKDFSLQPGQEQMVQVGDAWANPKLWWPDAPNLYTLRTTVTLAGKPVDVYDQRFGFREWTLDGIHFKLNGVIYHAWEERHSESNAADWLKFQKSHNVTAYRFWGSDFFGMNSQQALEFFDENGIPVRRSEHLDGEGMNYQPLPALIPNWRDQLIQQVRSERNHPSIMLYSCENEFLYINVINLAMCDTMEPLMAPAFKAVEEFDPTHAVMTDGGGALKSQELPVHGTHYMQGPLNQYPALAYGPQVDGGGRGRWVWDMKRPRFIGEDWFLTGNHPEMCVFGGEAAMAGKSSSLPAIGRILNICQQGYRWADFGGWSFWMGQNDTNGEEYNAFSARAAFCRQWDWTFASGAKVPRTIGIFNDTHSEDPITFNWSLVVDGKQVAGDSSQHHVVPGTKEVFDITVPMPTVGARTEGQLILTLTAGGQQVFQDTKDVSILPAIIAMPADAAGLMKNTDSAITRTDASALLVYDPAGTAVGFLKQRGVAYTELPDLKTLPANGKVLLIGKDALTKEDATSTRFAIWAQTGRTVIALEQSNPLKFQALPAEVEPAENEGRTAFLEDTTSPVARNLQQKDFFTWSPDEIVYRNAYEKPIQGARSLIECDAMLRYSALIDIPVGKGMILLSQLVLEEKLADNPVAQQLLANLINFGDTYSLETSPVTLTTPAGSQFGAAAAAIGLQYSSADDPLAAVAQPGKKIALITATPENLAKLADNKDKVDAFTQAGGWIIFNDLTPQGLSSYNKLVGVEHLIRPFGGTPSITNHGPLGVERITFSEPRNPLTAGMALGDVVQYSGMPIFGWTSGNFTSADEFSYIVDYDEVAPFGASEFPNYGNITNGFTNADGWPLIINAGLDKKTGSETDIKSNPFNLKIKLPRPETIREFTFIGNNNYYSVTKINLIFDGNEATKQSFDVHSDSSPNILPVVPPQKASTVTLQLADWTVKPNSAPIWGIDNIYMKVQRDPGFLDKVKPMLNIGGMMEYPHGQGGIILCNLLFKANEQVPVNMQKKRTILADLLRNLNAPFAAKTIIVGAHLDYAPIDISKQANQFRTDRGWFGNAQMTFSDLPTGTQNFGGVTYNVYDFPTSPVPTCIMLGGPNIPNNPADEVKGIPVNRKADALFFLQTARIDQQRTAPEVQNNEHPALFKYLVHYADGQTVEVPVMQDWNVGNYFEAQPAALPGAALAWSAPFGRSGQNAAAWSQQWNNPRPDVQITSIDVEYANPHVKRAIPAVLAITAATAQAQ